MNKKQKLMQYLEQHIDFDAIQHAYDNSWLKGSPHARTLPYNGIVFSATHAIQKDAIQHAGYKHPDSDATLTTAHNVVTELINKHINY